MSKTEVPNIELYGEWAGEKRYPHCDPGVLHAPGECQYCDSSPRAQADRLLRGVNFTGQSVAGRASCPSDARRGLGGAHAWGGNRPKPAPPANSLSGQWVVVQLHERSAGFLNDGVETIYFGTKGGAKRAGADDVDNLPFVVVQLP